MELFEFRKFSFDHDDVSKLHSAAIEKLQTLYPGKRITSYDALTIGIESDSDYCESGIDTYELGLIDEEIPAIRNCRDQSIITFRI